MKLFGETQDKVFSHVSSDRRVCARFIKCPTPRSLRPLFCKSLSSHLTRISLHGLVMGDDIDVSMNYGRD